MRVRQVPVLLCVALLAAISTIASAEDSQGKRAAIFDADPDLRSFHGVPIELKEADIYRLPHPVKKTTYWSEEAGENITYYTIDAERDVKITADFRDDGTLESLRTSSPNAVGPKGIGVGSSLSEIRAAWPEGRLDYGADLHAGRYVSFGTEADLWYYFEPDDMPAQAFVRDYDKSREIAVPNLKVKTIGLFPSRAPNEDYSFLTAPNLPCLVTSKTPWLKSDEGGCIQGELRRYRGTVLMDFDTAWFSPDGKPPCVNPKAMTHCLKLVPTDEIDLLYLRADYVQSCPELLKITFFAQPSLPSGEGSRHQLLMDELYGTRLLPTPPGASGQCTHKPPRDLKSGS